MAVNGGELLITTGIDTKEFEKQLSKLEKDAEKYLQKAKKLEDQKAKLDIDTSMAEQKLYKFQEKYKNFAKQLTEKRNYVEWLGKQSPADQAKFNYEGQIEQLKKMEQKYEDMDAQEEKLYNNLERIKEKHQEINNAITENNQKIKETQSEIDEVKNKMSGIPVNVTDSLQSGFNKLIKSAKKLTMGIIGIRASYGLVRKMASSYLADNEQTAKRMANLWTGLGVLMGNIIENIVGLLKKAVTAILYFASILTNVNYIAKANEAILKKQAKATANLRKEQNKLNASFDEMEVLQDNSSATNGIGSTGAVELFDVEELGNAKQIIEDLAIKLKPVWDILKGIVNFSLEHPGAVIAILGGIKLIEFLNKIIGVAGTGKTLGTGLAGIMSALTGLIAIGTIVIAIKLKNESDEFSKTLSDIREQGKNLHKDFLEKETDINKILENSNTKRKSGLELIRQQSFLAGILTGKTLKEALETIKEISRETNENIKKEIELYNAGEQNVETQQKIRDEIYEQYLYNLEVIEALKKRKIDTTEIEELNADLVQNYKDMGGQITEANNKLTILKKNSKITAELDLNTKKAEKSANSFWESFLEPFNALKQGIYSMLGGKKTSGMGGRAKGGIYYPKLAVGGIINQPGRGVPYHGATIGERGAEAVIPLTDSQQMALLGEAIGKYITINANITNTMNGRIISKELQKIQNESDFVYNR